MKTAFIVAGLVFFVGGLFYWAFSPVDPGFDARSGPRVTPEPDPPSADLEDVPAVAALPDDEPSTQPEPEPDPDSEPESEPSAPSAEGPPAALQGLQTEPITYDEMRQAGVPERFKGGVRVSQVRPDSPAAEVALEPGDIIVRGQTTMVESGADLEAIVRGREYTRVMFVRGGRVMQVVLKPPFQPE